MIGGGAKRNNVNEKSFKEGGKTMSFRCRICGKPQSPRTKPTKVVLKERRFILEPVQKLEKGLLIISSRERREIVKEVLACQACASKAGNPEVIEVVQENLSCSSEQSREETEMFAPAFPFYLLYFAIAFSGLSFNKVFIASVTSFSNSLIIFFSSLLNL